MVQYTRLTRPDIRAFDKEAKKLILEAMERDWLGTISTSGHAILRAPDGETTMSVSRSSLNGRSGKNMRAEFDRWCREHPETDPAPRPQPQDPWLTCEDCQNLFVTREDLDEHRREAHEDRSEPVPLPAQIEITKTSIPSTETRCDICGETFGSPQARGAHQRSHREDQKCAYCGKTVRNLRVHVDREHGKFKEAVEYVQTLLADLWRLTEENQKLREEHGEVEDLREQLAAMTRERDNLAAKFDIIKEATAL